MYTDSFLAKNEKTHTLIVIKERVKNDSSELQLLTPPLSSDYVDLPAGVVIPPHLPKMFADLLIPVKGLKNKKLPYDCSLCGEELATWNSLVTHNKSHLQPACLACGAVVSSASKLPLHMAAYHERSVVVTSKYGRSRPVKSYLASLK